MKINYQQSFRFYKNWVGNPDCKGIMCRWYQNKARFYMDEVKYKEENVWRVVPVLLFYLLAMPIILFVWCIIIIIMNIYHWILK